MCPSLPCPYAYTAPHLHLTIPWVSVPAGSCRPFHTASLSVGFLVLFVHSSPFPRGTRKEWKGDRSEPDTTLRGTQGEGRRRDPTERRWAGKEASLRWFPVSAVSFVSLSFPLHLISSVSHPLPFSFQLLPVTFGSLRSPPVPFRN